MNDYKLTKQERELVVAAEPLLQEFAEGLDREQQNNWYCECAELLCDLAHNYWMRCQDSDEEPLMEVWLDEITMALAVKRYLRQQLDEAFDMFHGGV